MLNVRSSCSNHRTLALRLDWLMMVKGEVPIPTPARQRPIPRHPCKDPDEPQSYDALVAFSVNGYEGDCELRRYCSILPMSPVRQ